LIARYGYATVGTALGATIVGSALVWLAVDWKPLQTGTMLLLFCAFALTLNFFRDPERVTPKGEGFVLAPADGKVVQVEKVRDEEYHKEEVVQVAIFMSPLDVHVNRFPIGGKVDYYRYIPGEYLVAFDHKSSLRNERTHIGVDNGKFKVLFKQIAGLVARRIVADVYEGMPAVAGERFGMIRFGSRVDMLMPPHADVLVRPGDRTVGGETVVAIVPQSGGPKVA